MIRIVSCCLGLGLLSILNSTYGEPAAPLDDGWSKTRNLLFSEALTHFRAEQKKSAETDDSIRFGEAMALFHRQPTTRTTVDEVLSILEELIAGSTDPDIVLQAAYLKARIVQLHPFEPDPKAATQLYLDLVGRHPETYLGQVAFLKASGLQLYDPELEDDDRPFAAIEREATFLSDPAIVRSYHLMMAEAGQRLNQDDAFILGHYVEAYEGGLTKPDLRANVLTRIIVLSLRLGDTETAQIRANDFRNEFPRDIRITLVEDLVTELEGEVK